MSGEEILRFVPDGLLIQTRHLSRPTIRHRHCDRYHGLDILDLSEDLPLLAAHSTCQGSVRNLHLGH